MVHFNRSAIAAKSILFRQQHLHNNNNNDAAIPICDFIPIQNSSPFSRLQSKVPPRWRKHWGPPSGSSCNDHAPDRLDIHHVLHGVWHFGQRCHGWWRHRQYNIWPHHPSVWFPLPQSLPSCCVMLAHLPCLSAAVNWPTPKLMEKLTFLPSRVALRASPLRSTMVGWCCHCYRTIHFVRVVLETVTTPMWREERAWG